MLTVDFDRLGLRPGERVLDMGCGAGRHAFEMYKRGADVVVLEQRAAPSGASRAIGIHAPGLAALDAAVTRTAWLVDQARASGVPVVWVALEQLPDSPWRTSLWLRGLDDRAAVDVLQELLQPRARAAHPASTVAVTAPSRPAIASAAPSSSRPRTTMPS